MRRSLLPRSKSWLYCLTLASGLGVFGCGTSAPETASLKDHATIGTEWAKIVKVEQEDPANPGTTTITFNLVSGKGADGRIYRLSCNSPDGFPDVNGLQKMAEAAGFAGNIRDLTALNANDPDDSAQLEAWHINDNQPALQCGYTPAEASLRKVTYSSPTVDKYFVSFADQVIGGKRVLFQIGCDRFARALGFDPSLATNIPFSLLALDYIASDEHDIHCIAGVPVGQGISWEQGTDQTLDVVSGTAIPAQIFTAKGPDRNPAPLTSTITAIGAGANCSWISKLSAGQSLIFQGTVPTNFANKACKIEVIAAEGQPHQDKKTVLLRQRVAPVLSTTCPATKTVSQLGDFPNCQVTADVGTVQILNQTCPNTFLYDSATKRLLLTTVPGPGAACTVNMVSKNEDLQSATLAITANGGCPVGHTVSGNSCVRVACDSLHSYGDHWTKSIPGGNLNYVCNASGTAVVELVSCSTGYEKSGETCPAVKCDSIHSYPQVWTARTDNGLQTKRCEADRTINVIDVDCDPGYDPTSKQECTIKKCTDGHSYGDKWDVNVSNGKRHKTCNVEGKIVDQNPPLSCNAGYMVKDNACVEVPPVTCPPGSIKVGNGCVKEPIIIVKPPIVIHPPVCLSCPIGPVLPPITINPGVIRNH